MTDTVRERVGLFVEVDVGDSVSVEEGVTVVVSEGLTVDSCGISICVQYLLMFEKYVILWGELSRPCWQP